MPTDNVIGNLIDLMTRAFFKAFTLLPFIFIGKVLWIRSTVDYKEFLDTLIGAWSPDVHARNQAGMMQLTDLKLWDAAKLEYWHSILIVASEPKSLAVLAMICIAYGVLVTYSEYCRRLTTVQATNHTAPR